MFIQKLKEGVGFNREKQTQTVSINQQFGLSEIVSFSQIRRTSPIFKFEGEFRLNIAENFSTLPIIISASMPPQVSAIPWRDTKINTGEYHLKAYARKRDLQKTGLVSSDTFSAASYNYIPKLRLVVDLPSDNKQERTFISFSDMFNGGVYFFFFYDTGLELGGSLNITSKQLFQGKAQFVLAETNETLL